MGKMIKETSAKLFEIAEKHRLMMLANPTNDVIRQTYENTKKRAEDLLVCEMKIKGQKFFTKVSDGSHDWWEVVKHLYQVIEQDGKFIVKSDAKDWIGERSWEFNSRWEAWAKIEMLVTYKSADRKYGRGDVDKDYDRVAEVTARRQRSHEDGLIAQLTATQQQLAAINAQLKAMQ